MSDRIKRTAQQELNQVSKLAQQGVASGAWLYPIKGLLYFLSHRDLWKPLLSKLTPTIGLGSGITIFMFVVTYLPQVALMAFTSGPLAAVTAALLVLSESSTLTMLLSKSLFIEGALVDTFDATLVKRGQTALVSADRQVKSGAGDVFSKLGKMASKPFAKWSPDALIRYVLYLPLNLIPVVGTAIFVTLQGKRYGPNAHSRYFQLKGMSKTQKEEYVEAQRGAFTSFGIVAVLLEMIPIAGIFFAFTNSVGAALHAADLETAQGTSPGLKQQARKAQ